MKLHSDIPTKMVDALQACDLSVFPNVHMLLQLALIEQFLSEYAPLQRSERCHHSTH